MKLYAKLDNGREVEITDEKIKAMVDVPVGIPVPEGITIERFNSSTGIQFGNKQCLYMLKDAEFYRVLGNCSAFVLPHELISCKREDLKVGNLAYRSDGDKPVFGGLENFGGLEDYCFILAENKVVYPGYDGGTKIDRDCYENWWKVVPIGEK